MAGAIMNKVWDFLGVDTATEEAEENENENLYTYNYEKEAETEEEPDSYRWKSGKEEIRQTVSITEETEWCQAAPDRWLLQQTWLLGERIS